MIGGAAEPPKISYLGGFTNAGNIAVPRPGILVVMAGGWRNGSGTRQVSSISIGGNSAAPNARPNAQFGCVGLRALEVAAGSIAISAAFSGSMLNGYAISCALVEEYTSNAVQAAYNGTTYGTGIDTRQTVFTYDNASIGIWGAHPRWQALATGVANGELLNARNNLADGQNYGMAFKASGGGEGSVTSYFDTFAGTLYNGVSCGILLK
ncbi:MAG: hypothetical protein IPK28_15290 [Devosia sp.]|nr:hypothetical protein [Devosia sp.]